jgi:nicotinamidase/pyrazinamidase
MSSALIVVDMQNGFLRQGNLASADNATALEPVVGEVAAAVDAGQWVIFTADTHEVDDNEFAVFPPHCVRGTKEAELVDELAGFLDRDLTYLLRKRRYSAMFETELEGLLSRHAIDHARICGVCTDICVLHTTADLRNRDIPVTVSAEATATFDAPGHPTRETQRWALSHMQGILGASVDGAVP